MTEKWTAIAREAATAAEHIGIGVTALGKANYAFPAYYSQAFFALTIGIERSCKLALAIDFAIDHNGDFPSEASLRKYGHKIELLLEACEEVSRRRCATIQPIPNTLIHREIIEILGSFSDNITRYYNLQLITGSPTTQTTEDPIKRWQEKVVRRVIANCCKQKDVDAVVQRAAFIDQISAPFTRVRHTSEDGQEIDSVFMASTQTGLTQLSTPYVRLHVLQIVRPIAELLSHLGHQAQVDQLEDVPFLSEFYSLFRCDDAYFRTRKVWSTYPKYPAS